MLMMNLHEILHPECVKVPLVETRKSAAIEELVDVLAGHYDLPDVGAVKTAVLEREKIRTTGIGQRLAIPHCKTGLCGDRLLVAIGKPAKPIDFESIDKKPVELIILLASPPDRTSDHIQVLASVSRLMLQDDFRAAALAATAPGELYDLFGQAQPTQSGA